MSQLTTEVTAGGPFALTRPQMPLDGTRIAMAQELCEVAHRFAHRGWALGGAGRFSVVLRREPMRLLVTPEGSDRAMLEPADCAVAEQEHPDKPLVGFELHELLVRHANAGAVLYTQSPAALALSDAYAAQGGLMLEGYDLLHRFADNQRPQRQWLPIIQHRSDSPAPRRQLVAQLTDAKHPARFGLLVRRCGLLSWGANLSQAARHAELLETLLATLVSRAVLGVRR